MSLRVVGVFRETSHSPQREFDDYEILRLTGKCLSENGFEVILKKPEEILAEKEKWKQSLPDLVFMMCEEKEILEMLEKWEKEGVVIVNPIRAIWNTYRDRMIPLLKSAKVSMPESNLVSTKNFSSETISKPVWIKRGDVHNCQKGDVVLVKNGQELNDAVSLLHSRNIPQALIQDHIDGDLVKFYGIGSKQSNAFWFKWFYHKDQDLKKYSFLESELKATVCSAANSMKLEVFGGDAVIDRDGKMFLIDINAWPSFALFRDEASKVIAEHIASHLKVKIGWE